MNSMQRIIKYCAMAVAIMLAVGIITGIVSTVFGIVSLIDGNRNASDDQKYIDSYNTFSDVKSIDVNNSTGELIIKTGETFRVEAENVTKDFNASVKGNGKLVIKDKKNVINVPWFHFSGFQNSKSKITVYLPANFIAENADINSGAGKVTIDGLSAGKLKISAGAGNINGSGIKADEVVIDGGVGSIELSGVHFRDTDIDCGVGKLNLDGVLLGDNRIDCGIGQVTLALEGNGEDYSFDIEAGVGSVFLDGRKISNARHHSSKADNSIKVNGGVGNVMIDFSTPSNW